MRSALGRPRDLADIDDSSAWMMTKERWRGRRGLNPHHTGVTGRCVIMASFSAWTSIFFRRRPGSGSPVALPLAPLTLENGQEIALAESSFENAEHRSYSRNIERYSPLVDHTANVLDVFRTSCKYLRDDEIFRTNHRNERFHRRQQKRRAEGIPREIVPAILFRRPGTVEEADVVP